MALKTFNLNVYFFFYVRDHCLYECNYHSQTTSYILIYMFVYGCSSKKDKEIRLPNEKQMKLKTYVFGFSLRGTIVIMCTSMYDPLKRRKKKRANYYQVKIKKKPKRYVVNINAHFKQTYHYIIVHCGNNFIIK